MRDYWNIDLMSDLWKDYARMKIISSYWKNRFNKLLKYWIFDINKINTDNITIFRNYIPQTIHNFSE